MQDYNLEEAKEMCMAYVSQVSGVPKKTNDNYSLLTAFKVHRFHLY